MPFEDETVEMANLCSPPQICAVTQETFHSMMDNLFPVELRVANLYVRTLPEHYLQEHKVRNWTISPKEYQWNLSDLSVVCEDGVIKIFRVCFFANLSLHRRRESTRHLNALKKIIVN